MFRLSRFCCTSSAVLVLSLCLPASAQQNSSEVPSPTIRVSTRMVLVDVVVTNKQGDAVPGLHPEDFALEENGKLQKIVTLSASTISAAAPALPPGIYSNRPQYRSPGGPITVMLLDGLNTAFSDQGYARRQMLNFVRDQYKPGQRMAIFTLTGSLNVLQDFTSDPQVLYTALQRFQPEPQQFANSGLPTNGAPNTSATGSVAASIEASTAPAGNIVTTLRSGTAQEVAAMQTAVQNFEGAQIAYAEEQRAALTLQALNSLARILGGLPGRKNVIWIAGNLPFSLIPENRDVTQAELTEDILTRDQHTLAQHVAGNYAATFRTGHAEEIRETAATLASAQVAIYPVDARGLAISTSTDSLEVMREMARETGGRAYVNQNEIKLGVARAFQDTYATYTLGYYPENKKWDGKYRRIKVKIKRDGIELQHRRGYYAFDPTQIKGYNPQQAVASALNDVAPSTLISFSAQIKPPNANSAAAGKVGVDFLVDANTLSVQDASGGKRLNFACYVTVFSPQGKMVAQRSQKVDRAFPDDVYKQILEKGMLLHMDIDPQPGNNQARLAVQDNQTGLVGTIDAPLTQ